MKGLTKNQAKEDGLNILRLFSLENKMSSVKSELSGGMLRKVALALALIGNPKVCWELEHLLTLKIYNVHILHLKFMFSGGP